jgi:hypothetical protein
MLAEHVLQRIGAPELMRAIVECSPHDGHTDVNS